MNAREQSLDFIDAVNAYMEPFLGTFAYDVVKNGHLDVSRFYPILETISSYRSIADSVVLSSGCGSGGDLEVCLALGAKACYGIEVDKRLLGLAQARFLGSPLAQRVDLRHYDGGILPYSEDSFDLIVSLHVVEHVEDADVYMRELFRVLKPGGVLFLEMPNRGYWREQHTLLPFIHMPANPWRNFLIRFLTAPILRNLIGHTNRQKLEALAGLLHPSTKDLISYLHRYEDHYGLELVEASYYAWDRPPWLYVDAAATPFALLGLLKMPTFRLVVGKSTQGQA